jgi:asparagine synthase (glutamine-hydrolysing)
MCGIAGVVWADPARPVERSPLERMAAALVHRGPDAEGLWIGAGVGLAHRRLEVIDLSPAGAQPMSNEDGSVRVVFNGEIYNFRELRAELAAAGHRFRSQTDTEVLVHLYEEHGERLLERIEGMFAFGLWDAPRRRLLLARDRVGKKPLKYVEIAGGIAFASELKALVAAGLADAEPCLDDVNAFLALGYVPAPATGFASIRKLPAGHRLVFEDGRARVERYWTLDFRRKRVLSPRDWQQAVRAEVGAAVRRRLVADVPLGAFLSGGIDSSIVVACMAEASSRPVETFSIGFDHAEYDELPHARLVAERFATSHHEIRVHVDHAELLPELARVYEEPFADPAALPSYLLARETRRSVTVALNGDGGDEGFGGYERYARALGWGKTARWLSTLQPMLRAAQRALSPGEATLDRRVDGLLQLGNTALERRYAWLARIFSDRERARLFQPEASARLSGSPLARICGWMNEPEAGHEGLDRLAFADLRGALPEALLVKVDLASMAHGLEARSPLLDARVLELAASAPSAERCPGGAPKGLLKQAFADVLPPPVLARPKHGFALPLQEWFRGPLLPFARELLLSPDARVHAYLRREALARLIDDHVQRRAARGFQLWSLALLELWQRGLVEQRARALSRSAARA